AAVVLVPGLMGWGPRRWRRRTVRCRTGTPVWRGHGQLRPAAAAGVCRAGQLAARPRLRALRPDLLGLRTGLCAEHSAEFGHDRLGAQIFSGPAGALAGLGPGTPCHFVGHSAGGNTIRLLQHLLATDFWGRGTSAAWVKSVTCIASPLNGSTATYLYGSSRDTGCSSGPAWCRCVSCVELIETCQGVPSERRGRLRHWRLEHWGVEMRISAWRAPWSSTQDRRRPARLPLPQRPHLLHLLLGLVASYGPLATAGAFLLLPCAFMCAERVDNTACRADVADWRTRRLVPLGSQRMPFFWRQAAGADSAGRRRWCRRRHAGQRSSSWRLSEPSAVALLGANRLAGDSGTTGTTTTPCSAAPSIWEPPRQRWSSPPPVLTRKLVKANILELTDLLTAGLPAQPRAGRGRRRPLVRCAFGRLEDFGDSGRGLEQLAK
uniref:Lipase n=1 Tax=Macrostomum lignano TaxID=282301 RepID=A0A1I8FK36_9PLAT